MSGGWVPEPEPLGAVEWVCSPLLLQWGEIRAVVSPAGQEEVFLHWNFIFPYLQVSLTPPTNRVLSFSDFTITGWKFQIQ